VKPARLRACSGSGEGAGLMRMTCPWSDCWCKAWPPKRQVFSTGQPYAIEALPHLGEPWIFRYRYEAA
jgi:hypothetical protein